MLRQTQGRWQPGPALVVLQGFGGSWKQDEPSCSLSWAGAKQQTQLPDLEVERCATRTLAQEASTGENAVFLAISRRRLSQNIPLASLLAKFQIIQIQNYSVRAPTFRYHEKSPIGGNWAG